MPETALISVVPLMLLAAGAVAVTMLLLSQQRKADELRRRMATLESTANDALADFQNRLDQLNDRLRQVEEQPRSAAALSRPGLNLNNRAQALRMLRRGANAETVALSLNLPRPEIELLIRIQEMSAASDEPTSDPPSG